MHLLSCIRLYVATLHALAMSTEAQSDRHSASHTPPWQADLAATHELTPWHKFLRQIEAEEDCKGAASRSEEERQLLVRGTAAEEKKEPAGRQNHRRGAIRGTFDNGLVDLDKHTMVDLS